MNSSSHPIIPIILAAAISCSLAQTWYSACVTPGRSYRCPGYLTTQKLSFPLCNGDQYACYQNNGQDTTGGYRRGTVYTSCNSRDRVGSCPSGFRRAEDRSSYCEENIGGDTIRLACTA